MFDTHNKIKLQVNICSRIINVHKNVFWKLGFQICLYIIILKEQTQRHSQNQHLLFFFSKLTRKTFRDLCSAEITCMSRIQLPCIHHDFERKQKAARVDYEHIFITL